MADNEPSRLLVRRYEVKTLTFIARLFSLVEMVTALKQKIASPWFGSEHALS
jgi:hypothetical protein